MKVVVLIWMNVDFWRSIGRGGVSVCFGIIDLYFIFFI